MKYIDLHCDALTNEGAFHVTKETLQRGDCRLQCFAIFLEHGNLPDVLTYCEKFERMCRRDGYKKVLSKGDLAGGGIAALLSVEGGGMIKSTHDLEILFCRGVRLLTLTWNAPNALGSSAVTNFVKEDRGHGTGEMCEAAFGLTPFGREIVERMGVMGMIVDVSHGSRRLFFDVAAWSKETGIPFVASHSNAAAVQKNARNLSDAEIRTLAACGGVMGLNFCPRFVSGEATVEGQRAGLLRHVSHILDVGGEDVLALGSDFDGIPTNPYLPTAASMPRFLEALSSAFGPRIAEKLAFQNARRVLSAVLPA